MKRSTVLALSLLAVSAAAASAAPVEKPGTARPDIELPVEGVVTNPDWMEKPTADQVSNVYPKLPESFGLPGRAQMRCAVSAQGALENCSVISEIPAGMGFAEAAMALTPSFRMRPRTVDGVAVGGGEVQIPIGFVVPPKMVAQQPGSTPSLSPAPTTSQLALARKLVDVAHFDARLQPWLQLVRDQVQLLGAQAPQSDEEQKAIGAVIQAAQAVGQDQLQRRAEKLARGLSERQMSDLISFLESPTGQAWITVTGETDKSELQTSQERALSMLADARRRFCQVVACLDAPTPKK